MVARAAQTARILKAQRPAKYVGKNNVDCFCRVLSELMNLAAALPNQISQSPKHEITLSAAALPKVKPQRANLFAGYFRRITP